jgi:hypothetical protein
MHNLEVLDKIFGIILSNNTMMFVIGLYLLLGFSIGWAAYSRGRGAVG